MWNHVGLEIIARGKPKKIKMFSPVASMMAVAEDTQKNKIAYEKKPPLLRASRIASKDSTTTRKKEKMARSVWQKERTRASKKGSVRMDGISKWFMPCCFQGQSWFY